jgi:hypothetical protein
MDGARSVSVHRSKEEGWRCGGQWEGQEKEQEEEEQHGVGWVLGRGEGEGVREEEEDEEEEKEEEEKEEEEEKGGNEEEEEEERRMCSNTFVAACICSTYRLRLMDKICLEKQGLSAVHNFGAKFISSTSISYESHNSSQG